MLHQELPDSAHGRQGGTNDPSSLRNRRFDKDDNFNFLSGKDNFTMTGGQGDENRNQVRPRNLGPLGRDPSSGSPSSHNNQGLLSPRSRLPCWSPLEPLPEIECGDDACGRVPPDGAEERRMEEEEEAQMMMLSLNEMKQREKMEMWMRKSSFSHKGRESEEEVLGQEDDDEWGDSDGESESSLPSGGSVPTAGCDRIGVGEPKSSYQEIDQTRYSHKEQAGKYRKFSRQSLTGSLLGNVKEEGSDEEQGEEQSSDSDGGQPELMNAVWTLRDRERFKAQEMEKHQVQLTMYRRLALIRWVRTLQGRVQEQQNRLQSSFDVILTNRKELLRMGAAVANTAAVAQS